LSFRWFVLLAVVGLALGVTGWSLGERGGSDTDGPSAAPAAPLVSQDPAAVRASTAPSASTSDPGKGHAPTHVAGAHGGSEILPSPSSAARTSGALPGLRPVGATTLPLVSDPLPRPATKTGTLVDGYPALLAPPARHTIAVSSVAGSGNALQAALTATCQLPCDPLRSYRVRLGARGFTETAAGSVENRPTAALRRGDDSVTVTVIAHRAGPDATTIEYAVFAILHTAQD